MIRFIPFPPKVAALNYQQNYKEQISRELKKEARSQNLRASNAISVYNPETTPLIYIYYFFRL